MGKSRAKTSRLTQRAGPQQCTHLGTVPRASRENPKAARATSQLFLINRKLSVPENRSTCSCHPPSHPRQDQLSPDCTTGKLGHVGNRAGPLEEDFALFGSTFLPPSPLLLCGHKRQQALMPRLRALSLELGAGIPFHLWLLSFLALRPLRSYSTFLGLFPHQKRTKKPPLKD